MTKPKLILEQVFLQEKTPDDFSEFEKPLEEIKRSNEEILRTYSIKEMKEAVLKKMNTVEVEKKKAHLFIPQKNVFNRKMFASAAAVCSVVLLSFVTLRTVPFIQNPGSSSDLALVSSIPGERVKGNGPRLYVYKKKGTEAVLLESNTPVSENDVLQISYIAGGEAYGAIISVDGNGVVTQHFPESGDTTAKLSADGEIPLGFSYKLDNAPDFERFIFITGAESFSTKTLKEKIERSSESIKTERIDTIVSLPATAKIIDILLRK